MQVYSLALTVRVYSRDDSTIYVTYHLSLLLPYFFQWIWIYRCQSKAATANLRVLYPCRALHVRRVAALIDPTLNPSRPPRSFLDNSDSKPLDPTSGVEDKCCVDVFNGRYLSQGPPDGSRDTLISALKAASVHNAAWIRRRSS